MAKKKQRINLIDRNGNSQVVQVNSSDLSDSTKSNKKASLGNVVKNTVSGIVKGGNTKAISDERNYGPLTTVARTVTGGVSSAKDKQGHNLIDNTKQVGKNLVSGAFSGVTSIPDSELYEVRNSLEKGEKKAEETTGVRDTLKSLFGTGKDALLSSNPITAQFVKDDDDSKGVEGALKGLKNVSDISGGKKGLYKSIEAFGEAYSDYKKAKGEEGKLSKKVEKLQEKIDKPAEEYAQRVQEENKNYSKPTQVIGETFQTVGNMAPSIAMSVATKNPSAGMAALYQGAKGSATKEALQKGADLDTATAIGNAKGLLEVGTEQLSGGIKFKGKSVYGQGALDDVIENNVNRLVKNKAANWLVKQFGTAPLGEIAEETISDLAGNFIDKNTVDPNAKYTAKDWLHTAGMTYLSTLTLNLLGGSFGKSSYNQNLQSMAETQVADIQNRVDRGLMSQEDGARAIEQITQELNDSIGTNEEISTPEEIQEVLANTSPEDIQQAVASAANAVAKQIEQGKINEQQGQQLLTTIQENAQNLLEQQQSMQNESTTIDNKIQLVQQLNDTERAALTEITQKLKRGEQLNEQDRATLQYLNSKGTPQTVENTPISNETTQPSAIPQEEQNVAQNIENGINNDIVNKDRIEYNNNTSTKEGVSNDFRTIQEESRRKLNEEGWGDSSKTVDEDLRGRIRGALSEELERRGYSNSDNDGLLKLESKGNKFNIHKNVDGETFHDMFEIARANTNNGELVDLHPVETNEDSTGYNEMNNYLSDDGMQGFSITKDGDVVSVFNADPTRKGFLRSIVSEINGNGKTLDCYNSSKQALNEIYSKIFGWKTASVMDHNMDYDHDNIAKNHDNPPVSFMVNPNQLKNDVTDADLNKKFGKYQYDEAFAYRSALMKDGNGNKNDFIFGEDGYFKGMKEGTSDSSFSNENVKVINNKQESFNNKAEETFRNIKTKEDMDNLISNLKDKVDNIKTGEDLKNTFKEIYDIYKVYNKSNDIYEIVEKDGLYGTRFESEFYNPDIKYKPLNEEIKIQKDNLESWLKIIKDDSEKIIYDNQDKITPTIGKNIDSIDKVTPITTDDFKNKLHDYIDKETEDIKGKFESKDGHLFRGGKEVRYLYRAIDQAEMDSIKNNGYIKSNQSKNIGYEVEQGLTDFKDGYPGFYLPRNADGYIIKIEVKPENGFFYDSDEYAKTPNEIPANQIVEINGEKINTQRETNQNKNIPDKVEDNVITIKNDDLKDTPKDQIKTEDTGIKIGDKPVKMEIPIDSKQNKIGQYVPKDGFTQKELKDGKIGDSKFYRNVTERADFINDEVRKTVKDDDNIKHYRKVTNEESMQEAFDDLNTRGTEAIADFFNNDKELTSKDTAMGWLLIEQSQANGDYNFANQVLRKMRDNATKTGQTMQMYNYYARLTPEGMYKWCGDQLLRAEEIFEKGKTKKWIEQNKDRWQLNGEEVEFINKQMERVQELNKMNDNDKTTIEIGKKKKEVTVDRAKQVEIAKIQSMIENKIPPQKGQALNAWMRISMLGNLKTIGTRNPLGNIALRPINDIGDFTSSLVDLAISKKTGVRTKGNFNPLAQAKGMARGASETIQDARLGINTRDAKGNRFEIGQGKSFNEHHKGVAKVLNPLSKTGNFLDSKISFLLDLGDRPFFEATYQQSLENQMKLNKIDKIEDVPDWMKNIAEQEALERTYQDDNNYTSAVIDIRRAMNKMVNVKGYGLGDVIIPFAKTPANITKAIVDYSPAGFVNALTKGKELRRSIQNGQFTPEMQHAFVNQLGKATAGTMLYGIGAALANSGIITGGDDEDKDVADFMRNTLGIQPYSIVIGDKSFTYDWAQPVASAFAIPADIKQGIQDAKEGEVDLQYIIHKAFSTGGNVLLEQSFLQGIKEVLGGYGDPFDNLMSEIEGLPARAVPTLFQQIVTYFDPTKRMSYGNNGIQNVISQAQAKTPWASDLPKYRNSMGKEIQMYGGKNSFFNVFLNPANYSEGNATESAEEIYRVYQATNKKEILPRLVDKNIKNEDGTKLTNEQKSEWLRISGGIIDREVERLTKNGNYLRMSDEDKADTIKAIVDYAYNEARNRVTGHELSSADRKASNAEASGYALADYFITKTTNKVEKTQKTNTRNRYMEAKEKGIDGKTFDDFHAFVASARGESRTGGKTKKQKIIDYIQGLPLTREQKEALYDDYKNNSGIISYYN